MSKRVSKKLVGAFAIVAPLALGVGLHTVFAADHLDPPGRVDPDTSAGHAGAAADRASDIADLYAWHSGTGATQMLTLALTFAGPNVPVAGQHMPCDRDVLYSIYIDNTDDAMPEYTLEARFAMDDTTRNCFIAVSGLPGTTGPVLSPIELNRPIPGGGQLYAGLRDDPFFFDLQGFRDTISNGRLINTATSQPYMQSDRDFFAGKNTNAIVIEFPIGGVRGAGTTPLRLWATTARHP